jgi:RND family efflux transporter MFP subunit
MVPAVVPQRVEAKPAVLKPKRRLWLWGAGFVAVAGLGLLVFFQPWGAAIAEVSVEVVALAPVSRVLAVNGRIAGVQSVDVRPQVNGTLTEVTVAEGERVLVGTALAQIDPAAQAAVVRQALAGLDASLVAEAEAQATYARTDALGTNAARVVLESAARAVQTAAQDVARMTALLEQARIQFQKFTIRAPLSGTALVLTAEPGQVVDPATVLMTIVDLAQLVIETNVDESYATQIKTGQPAVLQLSGETVLRDAHISFVSQRVDETTGGLAVKLTPDAPLTAPIGLTVTANITVDDRAAAITVPRAAIVRDARGDSVLVVTDGVAQRRGVTVIDWPAARLIATEGLVVGDVVISDATGIVDGQAVKVTP